MTPTPASPAETVDHETAALFALYHAHESNLARAYLDLRAQLAKARAGIGALQDTLRLSNELNDRNIAWAEAAEARATASEASRAAMREVMHDAAKSIRRVLDANPDAYRHGQAELIAAAQWLSAGAQPGEDGR